MDAITLSVDDRDERIGDLPEGLDALAPIPVAAELERDGVAVGLDLAPAFDREMGILRFAVEAPWMEGDGRRSVATTVTIPFRDGGARIELSVARVGESVRVLVLIPRPM
jgi:hypothetical protein